MGNKNKVLLKDICNVLTKGTTPSQFSEKGINFIRIENINGLNIDSNFDMFISEKIHNTDLKRSILKKNDILFAIAGATVGKCAIVNEDCLPANTNQALAIIRLKNNYDSFYIANILASEKMKKYIYLNISVGAQPNLSLEQIGNFQFYVDDFATQTKIATFLNLYYKKIELQKKKIEQLNKLFTKAIDKISHLIDKKIPFCQCYVKASEGGTPSTAYTEYYENGTIPFVKIEDLYKKFIYNTQSFITELGLKKSSAWLIPINSVIYSNGATIGEISLNKIEVATKQGILGIVPQEFLLSEFLYYYMKTEYFRREICKITTHGTMMCAYLKDIDKIDMYIPDINTQKNELNKLNTIYKKIELEKQKLETMEKYKNGLLQQLFI